MTIREIHASLPHPALPEADWIDCFETDLAGDALTALRAAEQALSHLPLWVRALMRARDSLVKPFGLKTADTLETDRRVGIFPLLAERSDQVVLGFDDRHLDFRIVIDVDGSETNTVRITTLVHRKIVLGRLYLTAVTPFHRLIVRSALGRLETRPG